MAEPLQEKYRPKKFDDFVGNEDTIVTLKNLCRRASGPPPAILLIGPRGCGKTTLAGIIQGELKVDNRDFVELDTASTRGVDTIREIRMTSQFAPINGVRKIYFLDECHKITNEGQNALLKLLEKPPSHVTLILATTNPEQVLATVRSRCSICEVKLFSSKVMRELIKKVLKLEKVDIPDMAIEQIIKLSEGSPREALVMLDTVIDIDDDNALINAIMTYNANAANIKDLCQALLKGLSWKEVSKILAGIQDDPESVRYAVLGYMNVVLLGEDNSRAADIIANFLSSFMYSKKGGLTLACYRSVNKK